MSFLLERCSKEKNSRSATEGPPIPIMIRPRASLPYERSISMLFCYKRRDFINQRGLYQKATPSTRLYPHLSCFTVKPRYFELSREMNNTSK